MNEAEMRRLAPLEARIIELERECERLREALEAIADATDEENLVGRYMAQKALAAPQQEDGE